MADEFDIVGSEEGIQSEFDSASSGGRGRASGGRSGEGDGEGNSGQPDGGGNSSGGEFSPEQSPEGQPDAGNQSSGNEEGQQSGEGNQPKAKEDGSGNGQPSESENQGGQKSGGDGSGGENQEGGNEDGSGSGGSGEGSGEGGESEQQKQEREEQEKKDKEQKEKEDEEREGDGGDSEEENDNSLIIKSLTILKSSLSYISPDGFVESVHTLPENITQAYANLFAFCVEGKNGIFYFKDVRDSEFLESLKQQDEMLAKYIVLRYKNYPQYFKENGFNYYFYDRMKTVLGNISALYDSGSCMGIETNHNIFIYKAGGRFFLEDITSDANLIQQSFLLEKDADGLGYAFIRNVTDPDTKKSLIILLRSVVFSVDKLSFTMENCLDKVLSRMKYFVNGLK